MPSSFTFTFDDECLIAYDTPQSKGMIMIDGDTIIVEWLITGDANRLAHLAIDEAKRQLIDTANQYKSVLDAIVTSCVGRRDFWLKLKQMNWLDFKTKSKYETKSSR